MKLKYDRVADRMRLVVERDNLTASVFWLRRNQCLALLARLDNASEGEGESEPCKLEDSPKKLQRRDTVTEQVRPVDLDGISVKTEVDGVSLTFIHAQRGLTLKLTPAVIVRLRELLLIQAERAGWDPNAGIQRLKAMAQARLAIDRSRGCDRY